MNARSEKTKTTYVALAGVKRGSGDQVLIRVAKEAARAVTDFGWLASGDSVLIKPALNSGNPYPSITNPEGIRTMLERLVLRYTRKLSENLATNCS